jgi:hypothetical protein
MKLSNFACYCCGVHKNDLAKPNKALCADCLQLGRAVCYHHNVMNEELIWNLQEEYQNLWTEYEHLKRYPFNQSKIKNGDSGVGNGITDPRHIEYEPSTVQQHIRHSVMVWEELKIRGISHDNYSPLEQRILLHEMLII